MKYLYKPRQCLAILLVMAVFMTGCNIFSFTTDIEKTPTQKAEEAIREGNYQVAREELADAVKDSTDAYALYLDAKATLHEAGVDIVKIVEFIEGEEVSSGDSFGLLAFIDEYTDEEQTIWYKANMKVSANLSKIFNQKPDKNNLFKPDDVALGYSVSNLLSGVLGIRDTNRDGIIDNNDFNLNIEFSEVDDLSGYAFDGGSYEDEFGNVQNYSGLEMFLGEYASKAGTPVKEIGVSGYEPDDINDLLVFVMNLLDQGMGSIRSLLGSYNSSFDTHEIEEYVAMIARIINFYWYDDGIDNDGDGRIDEETINGIDDDHDGFIDEDSHYHPADPTDDRNTQYNAIWENWRDRGNE